MPLLILTGYPSSGKTTKCDELKDVMTEKYGKTVHVIREEIGFDKNVTYADSGKEKNVRSEMKASLQRLISPKHLIILDSLNYIKGYRYELYCLCKSSQTTHCVVHCAADKDTCFQWNETRCERDRYTLPVFEELVMRYETPNPRSRWDSPLFVVTAGDELPSQQIFNSLFERVVPQANLSTLSQPLSATNFLYELDRVTQDIITAIVSSQKHAAAGDSISIPGSTEKLVLTRTLTLMELQRYRRQFVSYTKTHPVSDTLRLPSVFVQYLQGMLS